MCKRESGGVSSQVTSPTGGQRKTGGLEELFGLLAEGAGRFCAEVEHLEAIREITSNKLSSWKFLKVRHDVNLWEFRF